MLESLQRNEAFEYQKLSPEEMKARGILGRLVGPCADFLNPTRNGRGYNEELWDKVFDDPIVNEKIENKACFGELNHPVDRDEVELEKVAIALNEKPKKNEDGKLIACFDILDTPCGRILKTLCDYGTTIGISSRGTGDVMADDQVDPDTYQFECFDAVIVPAVKEARLKYVTESLGNTGPTLRQALTESLAKEEDPKNKAIMEEAINNLGIKLDESNEEIREENKLNESVQATNTLAITGTTISENNGMTELTSKLTEALEAKANSDQLVKSLQEQLAVSNTKVEKLEEDLTKSTKTLARLGAVSAENKILKENVEKLEKELESKISEAKVQSDASEKLTEARKERVIAVRALKEDLSKKDDEIKALNESLTSLKEDYEKQLTTVKEDLAKTKQSSISKIKELNEAIVAAKKETESYMKLAESAADRYIAEKAKLLDVEPQEIKNKLKEAYTLDDVDKVYESMKSFTRRMGKLPFGLDRRPTHVSITESRNDMMSTPSAHDDSVDEMLLSLAGLND